MKSLLSSLIFSLAVGAFGQIARYESLEDGFSIQFPGEVTRKEEKLKQGSAETAYRVYRSSVQTTIFQVAVTPLPIETLRSRSTQDILDSAVNGVSSARSNVKLENEQKLLVNGAPGRRFLQQTEALVIVHLLVVANGRLYHVLGSMPQNSKREGEEFVKSFSLSSLAGASG